MVGSRGVQAVGLQSGCRAGAPSKGEARLTGKSRFFRVEEPKSVPPVPRGVPSAPPPTRALGQPGGADVSPRPPPQRDSTGNTHRLQQKRIPTEVCGFHLDLELGRPAAL